MTLNEIKALIKGYGFDIMQKNTHGENIFFLEKKGINMVLYIKICNAVAPMWGLTVNRLNLLNSENTDFAIVLFYKSDSYVYESKRIDELLRNVPLGEDGDYKLTAKHIKPKIGLNMYLIQHQIS